MQRLILYLIILLALSSCKSAINFEESEPQYKSGDSVIWAQPNTKTVGWLADRPIIHDSIFWIRLPLDIKSNHAKIPGLQVHTFGAFDIYWDGVLIGKNGQTPINGKPEIPGPEASDFIIPKNLSQNGKHLLAFRASQSFMNDEQRGLVVRLDDYPNLLRAPLIVMSFMNLMAGAFFIAGLYYMFLYINSNKRDLAILVFGVVCLFFFMLLILEYIKFYVAIPYSHFYLRLQGIGWLTFAISLLVPFYFTIQFNLKRKGIVMGILLSILAFIYWDNFRHYDITAIYYSNTMWIAAVIIVLEAIRKKETGGLTVFAGLMASAIVNYFFEHDFGLFVSFTIIIICMLYLHTVKAREAEQAHDAAIQLSSRLKLELIKKNIQPHFIKNTLTSLIDWIEESPAQGAIFLQALAQEFDLFNTIADQTLIPVHTEILLCKTHLQLMSFRKEINYTWEDSGIDPDDLIPPAIIHTLLENGITHSAPDANGAIGFKLTYKISGNNRIYCLETIAVNREKITISSGGTGFKYVAARLKESYADRWDFKSEATVTGWLNTITIHKP